MINELERLWASWPFLAGTLLVTISLVAVLFTSLDVGSRFRIEWMGVFFIGVPLSLVAGVLVTGRNLSRGEDSVFRPDMADVASGNWISRVITLICLGVAVERLVRFIIRREYRDAPGLGVVMLLMAYVISVNLLSAFFGTPGGFSHQLVYAPIIALAVFAYAQQRPDQCFAIVRNTLVLFLLGSLLFLVIRPEMVAETRYRAGLFPGLTVRFYGFATHPNTLAPLCLLLVCAIRLRPFNFKVLNGLSWGLAITTLLLTQSKTSIGLALIGMVWFLLSDGRAAADARGTSARQSWRITTLASGFMIAGLIGLAVIVLLSTNDQILSKISALADRINLNTLTGRTRIWDETLNAASKNWVFGYGPELWGLAFRINLGLPFTHAHNQFIHTLGAGGVIGLLMLLAYLAALGRLAWKVRAESLQVSLVLYVFLLLRGLAELPLNIANAMQGEFIVQMFLLVVCIQAAKASRSAAALSPKGGPAHAVRPAWRAAV